MRALFDELLAAVRGLARAPGFTALAVCVLGLGLGATIFMYGVADALVLKPPPYPDAGRIHLVVERWERSTEFDPSMSTGDYLVVKDAVEGVEAIGSIYTGTVYLTGDGPAERYDGGFVKHGLFEVADVKPMLGRVIEERDTLPGAAAVVVLSHALWKERYGADPGIVGRALRLNGQPTEVVGVMPEGFHFPGQEVLWLADTQGPAAVGSKGGVDVGTYLRLKPGVSPDEVQASLAPAAAATAAADPDKLAGRRFEVIPFAGSWVGQIGRMLLLTLLAAVGFVLLIACANVSNLLLARAAYRTREATVRAALGATRGRLVVHMLAESLFITVIATAFGLLLASIGLDVMRLAMEGMEGESPRWLSFEIDGRVALATVLLGFVATLLAGLPAAVRATRPSLDALLRDGGRTGTGLAIGRIAWTLVVVEITLACALLGGAALMTRSVLALAHREVGVATQEIMTARVGLPLGTYVDEAAQIGFFDRFQRRLEAQPEVESAALTQSLPVHGAWMGAFAVGGRSYGDRASMPEARMLQVTPSFFETFRLPALAGRPLLATDDAGSLPVAVVGEALARENFPDGAVLGQRLRWGDGDKARWITVVGVVRDVLYDDNGEIEPTIYVPLAQEVQRFVSIAVRGAGSPETLAGAMRRALAESDPDLAIYWVRTLEEGIAQKTFGMRIIGTLFAIFGMIALVLAAAGLFGVLSFHVGQRTREIGVRRALGASDRSVLRMIAEASGGQVAVGLLLGLVLLPVLGRVLSPVLVDTSPFDPAIYGGVLVVMLVVAAAAILRPTLRALRVDPAAALRYE
jgi:putative ABC transport system permease protein